MSGSRDANRADFPFSLTQTLGPWVAFVAEGDRFLDGQLSELRERGGVIRHLDAARMLDPASLFREFARSLNFPGYFGHNWDALVDCLDDLHGDWHGNAPVAIVIDGADLILEAEHLRLFVSVLCQAAERANSSVDLDGDPLDRPANALHFVFMIKTGDLGPLEYSLRQGDRTVFRRGSHLLIE